MLNVEVHFDDPPSTSTPGRLHVRAPDDLACHRDNGNAGYDQDGTLPASPVY
jgi:hypothetical protein